MIEHGRLELGQVRPDYDILGEIVSVLSKDLRLDPNAIELDVKSGVVRLSGLVSSEEHRNLVEGHAYRTPGVREVDNSILTLEP